MWLVGGAFHLWFLPYGFAASAAAFAAPGPSCRTGSPHGPAPVTDLVVKKAPEPTPAPVVEATPPPMKLETFFSKGSISKYTAKQDAARLTSFAQTNVLLGYKAKHTAPGETHTVELEGRLGVGRRANAGFSHDGKRMSGGVCAAWSTAQLCARA